MQSSQKQDVMYPEDVTKEEHSPLGEPVLAAQFSAMRIPRLLAQTKWVVGRVVRVKSGARQMPSEPMLPHMHAPVPCASTVLHRPAPHGTTTTPACASQRTHESPAQWPYSLTPWHGPPMRTQASLAASGT
ncbi:hypothetical protein LXT21_43790 [Myxococcus sp. K38C18041901]|uniref:hypothetical protein n=1 Tax=Myxococcus guangdongensis TaxID=2906760 RepID=UPI0020A82011|nr:hypothetical protein [Myxococcus guangdongensis]MCP3065713.1 hypothetical protein [Myxococcus guangdongensis]